MRHLPGSDRYPYDARLGNAVSNLPSDIREGIRRHPTDVRSEPGRRPVDVYIDALTDPYLFSIAFQMPGIGTGFKCQIKSTRRPSDA